VVSRLPHPFTAADRAADYRYAISILQAEFSLTQMLDAPVSGRIFFEQVIRDNLDLGRPDHVGLVFNRRVITKGRHPTPSRFRTRVIRSAARARASRRMSDARRDRRRRHRSGGRRSVDARHSGGIAVMPDRTAHSVPSQRRARRGAVRWSM